MDFTKHYKIAEFLRHEFDRLKAEAVDKKVKFNSHKQKKKKEKMKSFLLKVEGVLFKVESLNDQTVDELKKLQYEVKEYLE